MSQLTAVDISDSDRFELAEVLKEESESSSAPRPLEDILQETCDDDFDPMSQRSCYELLAAYIARPTVFKRIGRQGMRQRDNITSYLSERVLARLRHEYSLVASEVWVDDDNRVDFVAFKPESFSPGRSSPTPSSIERGEFVFVEVKSCMADFKSGHGLTFQGDSNWLVCPQSLAESLYQTMGLPNGAAVFCPDAGGRLRKKFDLSIGAGSFRTAPASELLYRMVNHSYNTWRTSRGVFGSYCPWCSPYNPKPLGDIDTVSGDMDLIDGIGLTLDVSDPHGAHLTMSHDNDIDRAWIPINYCPICGRNFRKVR